MTRHTAQAPIAKAYAPSSRHLLVVAGLILTSVLLAPSAAAQESSGESRVQLLVTAKEHVLMVISPRNAGALRCQECASSGDSVLKSLGSKSKGRRRSLRTFAAASWRGLIR